MRLLGSDHYKTIHQGRWTFFLLLIVFSLPIYAQVNQASKRERSNRLEDLFIWKVSEELDLTASEERDVVALIRDLDSKKIAANEELEQLQSQLMQTHDRKATKALLGKYRKALINYNELSLLELDRLQKLLQPERVAKYIVVKGNLSQRIRNILGTPTRANDAGRTASDAVTRESTVTDRATTLPDPKVIEE